jgi:probable F420-dependent oxidoreductase
MKVGIAFANAGPFTDPDNLLHLAQTAESVGVESIWSVEHVLVPLGYKSEYPYDPSGKIPGGEELPIPDPVLPLAFVAAATSKLRLGTGVMILPQRHPAYVAKEIATLDVLSRGRAILGIGVGWLREEFDAVDVDFDTRGSRTKESVAAIRSLWADKPQSFAGRFFNWGPVQALPKPVQPGGVPIVIGGHSELAAKRAARYCDGFFPGRGNYEEIQSLFKIMEAECKTLGRNPAEIELTAPAYTAEVDAIKRLEDLGVSRVIIAPPGFTKEDLTANLNAFGDKVLSQL